MELNSTLTLLAIIALGASNVFVQWRTGANNASLAVITAYKEQVSLQDAKIAELTHAVGSLKGQLEEKDKRIELLKDLATGNTPESQAFMKRMIEHTSAEKEHDTLLAKTLAKTEECLKAIHLELKEMSKRLPDLTV